MKGFKDYLKKQWSNQYVMVPGTVSLLQFAPDPQFMHKGSITQDQIDRVYAAAHEKPQRMIDALIHNARFNVLDELTRYYRRLESNINADSMMRLLKFGQPENFDFDRQDKNVNTHMQLNNLYYANVTASCKVTGPTSVLRILEDEFS